MKFLEEHGRKSKFWFISAGRNRKRKKRKQVSFLGDEVKIDNSGGGNGVVYGPKRKVRCLETLRSEPY